METDSSRKHTHFYTYIRKHPAHTSSRSSAAPDNARTGCCCPRPDDARAARRCPLARAPSTVCAACSLNGTAPGRCRQGKARRGDVTRCTPGLGVLSCAAHATSCFLFFLPVEEKPGKEGMRCTHPVACKPAPGAGARQRPKTATTLSLVAATLACLAVTSCEDGAGPPTLQLFPGHARPEFGECAPRAGCLRAAGWP